LLLLWYVINIDLIADIAEVSSLSWGTLRWFMVTRRSVRNLSAPS